MTDYATARDLLIPGVRMLRELAGIEGLETSLEVDEQQGVTLGLLHHPTGKGMTVTLFTKEEIDDNSYRPKFQRRLFAAALAFSALIA